MSQLIPSLAFAGNAEDVLTAYQNALGGNLELARFRGTPAEAMAPADWLDKILYGSLHSPFGILSAMDAPPGRQGTQGDNFSISVQLEDEAQAERIFMALAGGGNVMMPFEATFFATKFGMLKDRFGIQWMIHVPAVVHA
jgi:PhnB protein